MPMAGMAMWFGIVARPLALLRNRDFLCGLSKLYPGAGSSYFFAEQAFLSKSKAYKFARLSKFIIGWASHFITGYTRADGGRDGHFRRLYGQYFLARYVQLTINSPTLDDRLLRNLSFGVAYIAYNGLTGFTGVNIAINVIQIAP